MMMMMMINAEVKDNTFELEFLGYFNPACMNEKCSFYTDLNNSLSCPSYWIVLA